MTWNTIRLVAVPFLVAAVALGTAAVAQFAQKPAERRPPAPAVAADSKPHDQPLDAASIEQKNQHIRELLRRPKFDAKPIERWNRTVRIL